VRDGNHSPSDRDIVRVSCANLALMEMRPGKVLLLASKHQLEQGVLVLVPPGGAIEIRDATVVDALGAQFESGNRTELRLRLDQKEIPIFRSWFMSRSYREIDPVRELVEELVEESRLLAALVAEEIAYRLLETREFWSPSQRRQAKGANTLYLHEIFRVEIAGNRVAELLDSVARNPRLARLVEAEEIAASRTRDGIRIGEHAKALLAFIEGRADP
jgi:SMODS-associated NUDIX domain